jgi:nitrate reductase gamma subunit
MFDTLLLVVLPYLAIVICIAGTIYRVRCTPLTYSSLSSQFLESNGLKWGSLPWHLGIITLICAHILALLCPPLWQSLMANEAILMFTESAGLGLGILSLFGLFILAVRRLTSANIQAVTSSMDLLVVILLAVQVGLGVAIAVSCKWGAAWCSGTTTPYFWSLVTLQPDLNLVAELPPLVKAHLVGAWLLILIIPLSRLIHMFAVPVQYLFRPPQNVVWTNPRKLASSQQAFQEDEARRSFVKASLGIFTGSLLLSIGTMRNIFSFFFGPRLTLKQESDLMQEKLERIQSTADQRSLELQRQTSKFIAVASMSELSKQSGKYFIDYKMQPGIAFMGKDGLPLLISAKCTHLGCTVGNTVDSQGKILCPCHVSYFDIETGMPNADAPAKQPLPHLGWVIRDEHGEILARRDAGGKTSCSAPVETIRTGQVCIAREMEEPA